MVHNYPPTFPRNTILLQMPSDLYCLGYFKYDVGDQFATKIQYFVDGECTEIASFSFDSSDVMKGFLNVHVCSFQNKVVKRINRF
jgi:hypothetical protein